jgi:hypothetical protein
MDPFQLLPSFSFKVLPFFRFTLEQFFNYSSMIHSYRMPYPLQSFHTLVTVWNCRNDMVRHTSWGLWGMVTVCWTNPRYRVLRVKRGYVNSDAFGPPTLPPSIKIHFWTLDILTMPEQLAFVWVTVRVCPRVCTIFSVWQLLLYQFSTACSQNFVGKGLPNMLELKAPLERPVCRGETGIKENGCDCVD